LSLYAESRNTGASLRIAALLNAGVKVFLCLFKHQREERKLWRNDYPPPVIFAFCARYTISNL
jgi:hypothetical protein